MKKLAFCIALGLVSNSHYYTHADDTVATALPEIMPTSLSVPAASSNNVASLEEAIEKGTKPKWIWGADQQQSYTMQASITVASVKRAFLKASGDNSVSVRINGKPVGSSDAWESPVSVDVTQYLKVGDNVIEADVSNAGGVAAMCLKLVLVDASGKESSFVSDGNWMAVGSNKQKDKAVVLATYGDGPWNNVLAPGLGNSNRDVFNVPAGFQVERLFKVPRKEMGSWVCLTVDPKGRLIASDQGNEGLYRITPAPIGSNEPTKVEKLKVDMSSAQGLLFAFDSLYVCVNGDRSGLYRLQDTNGDDQFDQTTKIADFRGGGEHGPHALRLSADGRSIIVAAGNHTLFPRDRVLKENRQDMAGARSGQLHADLPKDMTSRILPNWDEDVLPTRLWDANGHATGIYAPGGWIAQTDPEGKAWEVLSIGYRNQYDFDLNAEGEMFVYDSDMEWDMGTSWYRPTRVMHATSGSEFGWRSGTACWPTYFADSLPSLVDIGPGSPVGVTFGYGAKFPAKYQKALYLCDWTFGTMYAIHMKPNGSSYEATKEEFVSRTPLPLTDAVIGVDGAMYFTVGGRGTQSELYRVTYVGTESTAKANVVESESADLRALRRKIESLHNNPNMDAQSVQFALSNIGHSDRYIRYAARVALERVPTEKWAGAALKSKTVDGVIESAMGVARSGEPAWQRSVYQALNACNWGSLSASQTIALVRAYELAMLRLGPVDDATKQSLISRFDSVFPSGNDSVDRELAVLLVHLDAPSVPAKVVPLLNKPSTTHKLSSEELLARNRGYGSSIAAMMANQPDLQQVHYAFVLREQRAGWTTALRRGYFEWFGRAQKWSGGNSYQKFLVNISNDAFAKATDQDRHALEALGLRNPPPVPKELPKPTGPGGDYSVDAILKRTNEGLKGRDYENGKKMYAAARCVVCHRFAGDGGSTGPDLTQAAGRFALKDLVEAIIEPSKVISDQYKTVILSTDEGQTITGRILSDSPEALLIATDPEDSTKSVSVAKSSIEGQKVSLESVMPKDLLKPMNEAEVLDLLAYLLSRGDSRDAMFRK